MDASVSKKIIAIVRNVSVKNKEWQTTHFESFSERKQTQTTHSQKLFTGTWESLVQI